MAADGEEVAAKMRAGEARSELEILAGLIGGDMKKEVLPPPLVYQWLNRGAYQIAYRTLCLDGRSYASTIASQALYALPDNCIKVKAVTYDDDLLRPSDDPMQDIVDDTTGTPTHYILHQHNGIRLYPIPDSAKTLYVYFHRRPSPVAADADVIDLPEELCQLTVEYALARFYQSFQPEMFADAFKSFLANFEAYKRTADKPGRPVHIDIVDSFFPDNDFDI